MLDWYEKCVAGFLFETHSVPDQVLSGCSTSRDPWRLRLQADVQETVKRTATFLRDLGVTDEQLIDAAPTHPSVQRLMEALAA